MYQLLGIRHHGPGSAKAVLKALEAHPPDCLLIEAPADAASVLRDSYVEYLSQLKLSEVEGSAGMSTIRAELLRRARALYPKDAIKEVLLQDFLVQ